LHRDCAEPAKSSTPAQGSQRVTGAHLGRKTPAYFVLLRSCIVQGHQSCYSCQLLVSQPHSRRSMSLVKQVCNHETFPILEHWLLLGNNSEIVFNTLFLLRGRVLLCLASGHGGAGVLVVSHSPPASLSI